MYRTPVRKYACMNMVYLTKNGSEIWLGDYYAATDIALLKKKNIKSVLTTAAMLGISYPKDTNINHKIINAFDVPTYKMTQHFDEAYQFINKSLEQGHILVHCAAGISRSTTCVLVYLMKKEGQSLKHGLDLIRSKRSIANPNYGFQSELKKYQLTLKKSKEENFMGQKNQKVHINVEMEKEKNAVISFLQEGNQSKKLNATTKAKNHEIMIDNKINQSHKNSFQRHDIQSGLKGQSINQQINNSKRGNSLMNNTTRKMNIAPQFLTFKLETPKIVTIKK